MLKMHVQLPSGSIYKNVTAGYIMSERNLERNIAGRLSFIKCSDRVGIIIFIDKV